MVNLVHELISRSAERFPDKEALVYQKNRLTYEGLAGKVESACSAMLALGLGPVGAAFFTWDIGMKRGDIQLLGVASYAAPLLSTLVLIASGFAEPSLRIAIACVLVTGGAVLAAKDMILRRRRNADTPEAARS